MGFSAGGANWFPPQIEGNSVDEKAEELAEALEEIGAKWYRPSIPWNGLVDEIDPCRGEEITERAVEERLEKWKWDVFEKVFRALKERGIELIVGIGVGYTGALPLISGNSCGKPEGERAYPDVLGKERYIMENYLLARTVVRRFRGIVRVWQIENELNVACETVLWGWREGEAWCRKDFLDSLISSLYRGVKEEDPSALTTHNFHTDLHWMDDVKRWYPYVDIIGIDAYPNYLVGEPVYGREVGKRVGIAVANFEKPVIVLETGYPTQPQKRRFSEENQARYMEEALVSTFRNGGAGILFFTLFTSEVDEPWHRGFQEVEPYWGLFRRDGSRKRAWSTVKEIFERWR